ncbi:MULTISPECIES: superoxide dismutase family protein [unclassified Virgibacillus]|uniref:superoxide dismutase family protein n=1 Tax=unclassified Virgibacillus TaxID=2620237 RepID=UPI0024DE7E09|nr:superoxide dismutase family protein [Virgibacillus sp. LDC-1]
MKIKLWSIVVLFSMVLILAACGNADNDQNEQENTDQEKTEQGMEASVQPSSEGVQAEAILINGEGEEIGKAMLEQTKEGVNITLQASKLTPGVHGFHIHEKGICNPPDFKTAGGHFNPTNAKHGFNVEGGPHAGDLPNIEVKEDGTVEVEVTAKMVTLEKGKENSLLKEGGTALVIHSGADDYESQPAGDAGERVACGVIKGKGE